MTFRFGFQILKNNMIFGIMYNGQHKRLVFGFGVFIFYAEVESDDGR